MRSEQAMKFAVINRLVWRLRFAQHAIQSIPNLLASAEDDETSVLDEAILSQECEEYHGFQEDLQRSYALVDGLVSEIEQEIIRLPTRQRQQYLKINGDRLVEVGVIPS